MSNRNSNASLARADSGICSDRKSNLLRSYSTEMIDDGSDIGKNN